MRSYSIQPNLKERIGVNTRNLHNWAGRQRPAEAAQAVPRARVRRAHPAAAQRPVRPSHRHVQVRQRRSFRKVAPGQQGTAVGNAVGRPGGAGGRKQRRQLGRQAARQLVTGEPHICRAVQVRVATRTQKTNGQLEF